MIPFALYFLKMCICSGVLFAYYHLALRNRVFHQYNRFYLLAVVFFSILFPLIPLPVFFQNVQSADAIQLYGLLLFSSGESVVAAPAAQGWSWQFLTVVLYVAVCVLLSARLVAGLLQIRLLMIGSEVRQSEKIKFVITGHAAAPFSFFNWLFWRRDIELESAGGQAIFRHELVHIREKHTIDKLFLQVVLFFFWINPFFWLLRRELQMIHEFIADKKAVGQQGASTLAAMILQAAYATQHHQFTNAFFQQPIKRRLAMLQKTLNQPQNAYLGRMLALPLCALLLFACAKKEEQPLKEIQTTIAKATLKDTFSVENIKEVRVNKTDSIDTFTIVYNTANLKRLLKNKQGEKGLLTPPPPPPPLADEAVVVIDGKVQGTVKALGGLDKLLKPEEIESINVLKDSPAIDKWGQRGKNGVIEITTKKDRQSKSGLKPRQGADVVHIEVDQKPHYPGGEKAWRAYLGKNLNAGTPVKNGAPPGTYPIQVQFKIANDGAISDIKAVSSFGYGMEKEVVALIQKSSKWMPAEINGYKVTTIHKQPVTFVVAEE